MTINEYFKTYYEIISKGDLEQLNDYFHSTSPFLQGIKQQYTAVRKQLNMNINIESIELVSKLDDLLVIRDRILFEGNKGEEVKKNYSGNLHVMIKENESWKLQSTTCLSVEPA
jgi:hypothetical protein